MRKFFLPVFLLISCHLFAQPFILRQDALEDIDSMNMRIREVHYNPFLYISEKKFNSFTDSVKASIPDSISKQDFIIKLYAVLSLMNDAHSYPAISQTALRNDLINPVFFPAEFLIDDENKVFIRNVKSDSLQKATQVDFINGIDLKKFAFETLGYFGGLPQFRKEMRQRLFSYLLYLKGLRPPFEIRSGKKNDITIHKGIKFFDALSLSLPQLSKGAYEFRMLGKNAGYLDFISMSGSIEDFYGYMDSVMRIMRKNEIPNFIVDLRNNSGGNSALADLLVSFISTKPYSLMGKRYWKISQSYKNYQAGNQSMSAYLDKEVGHTWQRGDCKPESHKFNIDSVYTGKVYFITGPFTFSSANMLADGVKTYKLGKIIGTKTGEATNDFGEVYSFKLSKSGIIINTTTAFDIGASCKEEVMEAVDPDILIQTSVQQMLQDVDPVLEYVKNEIKN